MIKEKHTDYYRRTNEGLLIFLGWGCGQGKSRRDEAFELGFIRWLEIKWEKGVGIFDDKDKLKSLFPYPQPWESLGLKLHHFDLVLGPTFYTGFVFLCLSLLLKPSRRAQQRGLYEECGKQCPLARTVPCVALFGVCGGSRCLVKGQGFGSVAKSSPWRYSTQDIPGSESSIIPQYIVCQMKISLVTNIYNVL